MIIAVPLIDTWAVLSRMFKKSLIRFLLVFLVGCLPGAYNPPPQTTQTQLVETTASSPSPSEESLVNQSRLAAGRSVKLSVTKEGWYRVTGRDLLAAGADPKTDPNRLQLWVDGHEVPLLVVASPRRRLGPGDVIEFYGVGVEAPTTDTRVYWVAEGPKPGRRIPRVAADGPPHGPTAFPATIEYKARSTYFSTLRNGEKGNIFGPLLGGQGIDIPLRLAALDPGPAAQEASLEVAIQGVSRAAHRIRVDLNGHLLGTLSVDGESHGVMRFPVATSLFSERENRLRLSPTGGETDLSLLDSIRLSYPRGFVADGGALRFTVPGRRRVRVGGFDHDGIRAFDISSTDDVFQLETTIEKRAGEFAVTLASPESGNRIILTLSDGSARKPADILLNRPSALRHPQGGSDLLILTPREFIPALEPLGVLRGQQGLQTMIVDIEDVFDEFSFGYRTPQAIRDFLQYAASHWTRRPLFVLLGGDASIDPRNHLGRSANADLVPTKLVDTLSMEAASDDWLADFDGDGLAEMAVGRLPFNNSEEARRMVAGILESRSLTGPGEALLVSDDRYYEFDFAAAADTLRALFPPAISVRQLDRGKLDVPAARAQLMDALHRGPAIVDYLGHGSVDLWRGNLLTAADVRAFTGQRRSILFILMTCLNGYFADPAIDCLAEALLKSPNGGAAAVWASSGQTDPAEQLRLNQALLQSMFAQADRGVRSRTLGEVVLKAKAAVESADIRRTWILFGDPSMPLY